MPDTTPLAIQVVPFGDVQWSGDIAELAALLADHMIGVIPESPNGLILGKNGGSEPPSNQGLWLNNNVWYNWSDAAGRYLPLPTVAAGLINGTLRKTVLKPTTQDKDIVLYLPDEDNATLATQADILRITGLKPTKTQPGGATISLDFEASSRFVISMTSDMTISFTGGVDGQTVDVWFITPPSTAVAFVLTWNGFYGVETGVLDDTDSTHYSVTKARIFLVGEKTFVEWGATWTVAITQDTSLPTVQSINVDQADNIIVVTLDKLLTADGLDETKFYLSRNGVTNVVTNAIASGKKVTLTATDAYPAGSSGTLSYNGTDIIDLGGNIMAPLAPFPLTVDVPVVHPITLPVDV